MEEMKKRGEIVIYGNGKGKIDVRIEGETVWLSQKEISEAFDINRTVVGRHIANIYSAEELDEKGTCAFFAHMGRKGDSKEREYQTKLYNLDLILSVGYRVNSKKATQFRIWATRTLKDYLTKGYVVNQKLLARYREKFLEAQKTITLIAEKSGFELLKGHERELIDLVAEYAKSWKVLEDFDKRKLEVKKLSKQVKFEISYDGALEIIGEMKERLAKLRVNVYMFGTEVSHKLDSVIGSISQTFDGKDLYPSVEEKAANLLYLVIKDHPFTDGNKRIGSMLFVYFLENNNFLYRQNGEKKISDNTLIALALLVASSDPREKDNIVKLIINLIQS